MELGYHFGVGLTEPSAKELSEEVVQTVPASLLVQRDHEQVGTLKIFEHGLAIGAPGDRVAQWTVESVQDRGLHEERPHPVRLPGQHLLAHVVEDEAVRTGECCQESVDVGVLA